MRGLVMQFEEMIEYKPIIKAKEINLDKIKNN